MRTAQNWTAPSNALSLKDHLAGNYLTLALNWALIPQTSAILGTLTGAIGATTNSRDMASVPGYTGLTFKSNRGGQVASVDHEVGQSSAGTQFDAVFDDDDINEERIASGYWDDARLIITALNYNDLTMGQYILFYGELGQVEYNKYTYKAEGRTLTSRSALNHGKLWTPSCTVKQLGDHRCKVITTLGALAAGDGGVIRIASTVTGGGSNLSMSDTSLAHPDGYFSDGWVELTSGPMAGTRLEVLSYVSDTFFFKRPAYRAIDVGTTYEAVRGCDRTPLVCKNIYDNRINYRGYDKSPTLEESRRLPLS